MRDDLRIGQFARFPRFSDVSSMGSRPMGRHELPWTNTSKCRRCLSCRMRICSRHHVRITRQCHRASLYQSVLQLSHDTSDHDNSARSADSDHDDRNDHDDYPGAHARSRRGAGLFRRLYGRKL